MNAFVRLIQSAFIVLLISGTPSFAQPLDAPALACDSPRITDVAFLRGEWLVRSQEPARTPARERAGIATVTAIAGGCALQLNLRLDDDYQETRLFAFDDRRSAWQMAVVDSAHGNIIMMEGHSEADGLEFISTHQRADRLLVDRVSMRRTESGWLLRTESAPGYRAPWRLLQEITFTPSE